MGAQGRSSGVGRRPAGRHRRTGDALIQRRDHTEHKPARRFSLPSPSPSALVGIAVLVLIAVGVIHLSGAGTAVPLGGDAVVAAESATAGPDPADDDAESDAAPDDEETGAESDADPEAAGNAADSTGRDDSAPTKDGAGSASGTDGPSEVVVHVSGAVQSPGVVRLPAGSRVDDALRAAGGATTDGELSAVNLARPVTDGEQIHVPRPGEEPPVGAAAPSGSGVEEGGGHADSSSADRSSADSIGADSTAGGAIDLNTASATDLEQLPGVGPAIAQRILEHREKNGPFTAVDGLLEVSGIGPATLEKIREQATV